MPVDTTPPPPRQRLRCALDTVKAAVQHKALAPSNGVRTRVLLFLSGGKDGIAAADTTVRACRELRDDGGPEVEITAVHLYAVKDLSFEYGYARDFCRRYDIRLTQEPDTHRISGWARTATYMHPDRDIMAIRDVSFNECADKVLARSGCDFGVVGYKGDDNLGRRLYLKQSAARSGVAGVDIKLRRCMPIWSWTGDQVYEYLQHHNLPIQIPFKDVSHGGSLGMAFTPEVLCYVKKHLPEDWRRILDAYPLAEAVVRKVEFYGK